MWLFIITYWFEVLLFIMAAVPSIILFAIKGRISNWFAKDLKTYEQQLDLLKMQKQLQYSNVYTKRAEIIANIYSNIARIDITDSIIRAAKFKDEKQKENTLIKYSTYIFESIKYASLNGVYLNKSIKDKLSAIHDTMSKDIYPQIPKMQEAINEDFLDIVSKLPAYDVKELMSDLIIEFQELLGIHEQ